MSRGLGHVKRAIVELIASEPEGAWTTAQLCAHIYPIKKYVIAKKHRVAVTRALRQMKLPPPWRVGWSSSQRCIYNAISAESIARRSYIGSTWEPIWGSNFQEWFEEVRKNDAEDPRFGWLREWRKQAEENRRAGQGLRISILGSKPICL
jgi:hypothetical protein